MRETTKTTGRRATHASGFGPGPAYDFIERDGRERYQPTICGLCGAVVPITQRQLDPRVMALCDACCRANVTPPRDPNAAWVEPVKTWATMSAAQRHRLEAGHELRVGCCVDPANVCRQCNAPLSARARERGERYCSRDCRRHAEAAT